MHKAIKSRNHQSGAVLYVALIMLVLLALIGIVAMQVALLQERMSANYFASNLAFQNAESALRGAENGIEDDIEASTVPVVDLPPYDCTSTFDPQTFSGSEPFLRRIDLCAGGEIVAGEDLNNQVGQIYQITVYSHDRVVLPSSESIVNSVFIP